MKNRRLPRALILGVCALLVSALTACSSAPSAPPPAPAPAPAPAPTAPKAAPAAPKAGEKGSKEKPIKIGSIKITGFAPAYILNEIGNKQGVYFEVIDFTSSTQRAAALLRGDIDMGLLGWTAMISMAANGDPLVALAGAFEGGQAVIGSKDKNITSMEQLKGKKVATLKGSMNELHLYSQLDKAGMKASDLTIAQMNLNDMPVALAKGDIDAYVGGEPQSSIALDGGYGVLIKHPYDTSFGAINAGLATTSDFLKANRAAVEWTVRLWVEATDRLLKNPDELKKMAVELFQQDTKIIDLALKNTRLVSQINLAQVEALADWELKLDYIKKKPDIKALVDTTVVDQVLKEKK